MEAWTEGVKDVRREHENAQQHKHMRKHMRTSSRSQHPHKFRGHQLQHTFEQHRTQPVRPPARDRADAGAASGMGAWVGDLGRRDGGVHRLQPQGACIRAQESGLFEAKRMLAKQHKHTSMFESVHARVPSAL
eukprot:2402614-Pleurochrysis_carterae.AAC.1